MKIIKLIALLFLLSITVEAQTPNQYGPFSYQFYQKLNNKVYSSETRIHSALKPYFFDDSLLLDPVLHLLGPSIDSNSYSGINRKLFNEHLINITKPDYTIYADFLPDFIVGQEVKENKSIWLNTRGYQLGGSVGKKFSFYTSGFENQGKFPAYYQNYIAAKEVVPGQSRARKPKNAIADWSYVSALISYTPIKYLNITFGQDKNFIGDGYRSMLLSDFASNYPFLKLTANLGNVQYMAMWAAMQDPTAKKLSYDAGNRKKGGVFHYLDWNISNRLSIGLFDAVVWAQTDSLGNKRGFDWSYANPIVFLRPLEDMSGSPDNAALGFTAKYEILDKTALYGQFFLDEFVAKDFFASKGDYKNKWGMQLGLKGADIFGIPSLNYLFEYNTAKPYTYSERTGILSYSQYSEPLAHPYGANFREMLGIISYSYKRFDIHAQLNYAQYGLDTKSFNYGKDIFKPYTTATNQTGNSIGQGLSTKFNYSEARLAYVINQKYNLRLEVGAVARNESNSSFSNKTTSLTFGLRSSFRNLYQDF